MPAQPTWHLRNPPSCRVSPVTALLQSSPTVARARTSSTGSDAASGGSRVILMLCRFASRSSWPAATRCECIPDALPVRDPFEMPSVDKIVTRAIWRAWPMRIALPDLGPSFSIERIAGDTSARAIPRATDGGFTVSPGVYLLGQSGTVDRKSLPAFFGALGIAEYHAPRGETLPVAVTVEAPAEYVAGARIEIAARVVDSTPPDSVVLSLRRRDQRFFRHYSMRSSGGDGFVTSVPADSIGIGPFEYAITVVTRGKATTFPDGVRKSPWEWNYAGHEFWQGSVVSRSTPVRLFSARADVTRLAFS